jgi:uncharacterized membrane protein YdjX (TVP38/TMEM64 family)
VRAYAKPLLLVVGVLAAGFAARLLPGGMNAALSDVGAAGAAWFVVGGAGLCAVGMPRQLAAYAGAFAFGLWPGAALALAAQILGCVLDLAWARLLGRDWARSQMQRRLGGRLRHLDAFLADNPFTATLTLRLLPVGNNLILNLLAGVSGIAAGPFLLASALGYLPQTIIFALLGAGSRVDEMARIALAVALVGVSAVGGALLLRRYRALMPEPAMPKPP